jgi:hypothetical protein
VDVSYAGRLQEHKAGQHAFNYACGQPAVLLSLLKTFAAVGLMLWPAAKS